TSFISSARITPDIPIEWKIVGAADFNNDGKTDLIWQHDTTGEKAIWLMDGLTLTRGVSIDTTSAKEWRIEAIGQFGGDQTTDLVLRNRKTGAVAIWIMSGVTLSSKVDVEGIERADLDWQIVGAADFNNDGQTDLLWRHATLGLNFVSFMKGTQKSREDYIQSALDTDWRIATQDMEDSRYRVEPDYGMQLKAVVSTSPI